MGSSRGWGDLVRLLFWVPPLAIIDRGRNCERHRPSGLSRAEWQRGMGLPRPDSRRGAGGLRELRPRGRRATGLGMQRDSLNGGTTWQAEVCG